METRTKLEIGVFITMALIASGAYFIGDGDQAYYCESRDLVGMCDSLSMGLGTRCYFNNTYKTCKEGWKPLADFMEQEPEESTQIKVFENGELYECDVLNGQVNSYSKCFSPTEKEAYLGELV